MAALAAASLLFNYVGKLCASSLWRIYLTEAYLLSLCLFLLFNQLSVIEHEIVATLRVFIFSRKNHP